MDRYIIWCLRGLSANIEQHSDGDWVKYEDAKKLRDELVKTTGLLIGAERRIAAIRKVLGSE